uniref:Short-tailed cyanophage tailspike receptor-binding domain n=1 Tax=unidentified TaxID=32644 RepID=UPI001CFC4701|nr:Chain A, Short-tailed cyanophage tailspike receptor-binding domain [unidentified]7EEA_B Chain B, Short-tailed cyanophage tailspike receptor-binding domain [unidentified]7EEA_C Chain C, Short-tailed cyanophage tailspike receptor-binding domain [unidentified]
MGHHHHHHGAASIGYKRESGARLRTTADMFKDHLNLKEYCPGDGTNQTTAFNAAIARAVSEGISRIIVPAGHYLVTDLSVTANGLVFEGQGESSRIQVASNNSRCFSLSGDRLTFRGLKFIGDGTASASANGIGILAGDATDLLVEDVWFDSFGFGGVNAGFTTLARGPKFIRTRHRNTGTGGAEIYLRGLYEGADVIDIDAATSNADWAVFAFDEGYAGQRDLEVTRGDFSGYKRYSIGVSDENPSGEDRGFGVKINGGHHKNAGLGAVKVKNYRGVLIQGVTTDNCGIVPIAGISNTGESGTFYINSAGLVDIGGCKLRDNGMDGITVIQGAPYPTTNADGTARNQYIVHDNQIDGCGTASYAGTGTGFRIKSGVHQAFLTNNSARGCTRFVAELGNDPSNISETITVIGNDFSQNLSATNGIYARYINRLKMDMNQIENTGAQVVYGLDIDTVYSGPGDRFGNNTVADFHVRFDSCRDLTLLGDYSSTDYTQWVTATAVPVGAKRWNGANAYVAEAAGTTGATAPTHTSGTVSDGGVNWRYIGKRRIAAAAVALRGTAAALVRMGGTTRTNSTSTAHGIDFSPSPTRWEWSDIDAGTATLAAGTVTVNITDNRRQVDGNYRVLVTGTVNETFYVSARAASNFTITSSNAASTATVMWKIFR